MDKPFKELDEQIEILSNRGLIIDDYDLTKNYLLYNNYYTTINGIGAVFANNDRFIEGTKFSQIVALQQFDSRFKNTIFKFVLDIEKYFKSVLVYEFSKSYPNDADFYLNYNCYSSEIFYKDDIINLINMLNKVIDKYSESLGENAIKFYRNHHDCLPLWVLVGFLDFGQSLLMYKCLPESIKNSISLDFSNLVIRNHGIKYRFTPKRLATIMRQIKELRNLIAHNNRLFYYEFSNSTPFIPFLHKIYGMQSADERTGIFHIIILLRVFLNNDQYIVLHNSIHGHLRTLRRKISEENFNRVLDSLNFCNDFLSNFPKVLLK